ncbi:hypothetical protein V8F33_000830 [Rhypophila sp. PSN 637]
MSGSGGFYKYRCKHFLTYNCNNWVYVNGAACACCLAEGRESEEQISGGSQPDTMAYPTSAELSGFPGLLNSFVINDGSHGFVGEGSGLGSVMDGDDSSGPFQELPHPGVDGHLGSWL